MSHTHVPPCIKLLSHDEEGNPATYNSVDKYREHSDQIRSHQPLSRVQLFATP